MDAQWEYKMFTPCRNTNRGFTLIELMVVVAIAGILSMMVMPSYADYVTRGKIPDATSNLAYKAVLMEQSFQDNLTYVGAAACIADTTTSQYFDFSCPVVSATTFTLQAAGKNSMAGFTYTFNQSNVKATPVVPAGWVTAANCWVTKKGGVC